MTIQNLGWQSEGRRLPLHNDLASVAHWYQVEPRNPFPPLPAKEKLVIGEKWADAPNDAKIRMSDWTCKYACAR